MAATAILFKEADRLISSKQSVHYNGRSCSKTLIPLGRVKRRLTPLWNKITKVTSPISSIKLKIYDKFGLSCLFPKLFRPVQPVFDRLSCKLGLDVELNNEGYMETSESACDGARSCKESSSENKLITRSLGATHAISNSQNQVGSYDECFHDIEKVTYGSRVIAKLVDDSSCEDSRYQGICQELAIQNRIIYDENCKSQE